MKKIKHLKQNYVVSSDFGFGYKSLRCIEYICMLNFVRIQTFLEMNKGVYDRI